ncbi:MAG: twin-arginine translocase subunit TatC [Deltaproteobacteria bacterium]|nr:twin-arginine translocase subunit TatC [Deltaproteobacteria bacterium]
MTAIQSPTKAQTAGDPPPQADPKSLTFFDHLSELRRRLIACLAAVAILTLASWNFAEPILALIMDPVLRLLPDGSSLIYSGLPDAFSVTFKVSLWTGAVLSAPFCLYQIWAFVAPGLMPDEKAKVPTLTVLASVLFLAGLAFAYFLAFPITFGFFLKFSSETMRPLLAVDRYMSLVMSLALAFALSFQLPLALTFLARLGLVTPAFLRKQRAYAIVAIFVLAAVLTPPDVISQIVLAAALMALYELSIFLVLRETHARERALANSLAEAADSDSAAHSDPDDTD